MISKLRFNTVVGKKVLMAVTGLAMVVFLIGHLIGNLQLLWSGAQFNGYAHFLTAQPVVILIELGLLAIFLLHIVDAVVLLQGNYAARPVPYHTKKWGRSKSKRSKKTWASTMMMWTGIAILLFVPFHVWHFKYHNPVASARPDSGQVSPVVVGVGSTGVNTSGAASAPSKEAYDLALQVTKEFKNPFVSGIYILAMILLGLHMYHAISSALTSVGANHPRYQTLIIWGGRIFTVVIAGGFLLIPALILSGLIDPAKTLATAQAANNQVAQVPMGVGK
ncbi:hypothetical protein IAD21_01395 [Abditibacteriota bacterium]|nr:hypothetical protein IAD21_01395 [Abditibacteriota bacterium]